jgi:membrane associated rhomboid family serine protease
MIPLSDGMPGRRFPLVNVLLIVANVTVWLVYELPHLEASVTHASFYPCTVSGACHGPLPWGVSWFTAMFMHGSWAHLAGNMLFLAIFGNNVEDAFGRLGYLVFYTLGGLAAVATQTAATLLAGTAAEARVPTLGASGAIAAVLGAYVVLYPRAKVFGLIAIFPVWLSAWFYLGAWFLYQLLEANAGLWSSDAAAGGVAFFAHVGGFVYGFVITRALNRSGRLDPRPPRGSAGRGDVRRSRGPQGDQIYNALNPSGVEAPRDAGP